LKADIFGSLRRQTENGELKTGNCLCYPVLFHMKRTLAKLGLCLSVPALLASCGAPGVPIPPALELPRPAADLRAVRKGDKVFLSWTVPARTTEGQSIRHMGATRVCRTLEAGADCKHPIAELAPTQLPAPGQGKAGSQNLNPRAVFVDILSREFESQNSTAEIAYAVEVQNENRRSAGLSNQVKVPAAPVLAPPENFAAQVTAQGVLVSWSCVSGNTAAASASVRYLVRVYRKSEDGKNDARVGEADALDCSKPNLLDQTFDWERNYLYRANVVTRVAPPEKLELEVEGDDTPEVKVFTHDIFPPGVPSGLQAAYSGVGQAPFVDLIWAPVTDADLAGYNIFRHEEGGEPVRINSELVKTPAYRDTQVASGKKYFYSVSAVDARGNESARSEEANEAVP